jgi:hypothetical protein
MIRPITDRAPEIWTHRLVRFGWSLSALLLLIWAALYVVEHAFHEPLSSFVYLTVLAVLLVALFYSEGTDVAVSRLYDKDPEQIPAALRAAFQAVRNCDPLLFISGRQLLAVFSIVATTLLCSNLADVATLQAGPLTRLAQLMAPLKDAFTLLFPTFFALWFAQLPPKFIAHESPLTAFGWTLTTATINTSIFLGRTFHVEGPSSNFTNMLLRWQARGNLEPLRPSREHYYKNSAVLRDGKALEKVLILVEVRPQGAVHVVERFKFRAFAPGFRYIAQSVGWEAPIASGASLRVVYCPVRYSVSNPTHEAPRTASNGATIFPVRWEVNLAVNLPIGEYLEFEVDYTTGAGATKAKLNEEDSYHYVVSKVPTAEITLHLYPADSAGFILTGQRVTVNAADDDRVNNAEAARVQVTEDLGGYRYTVNYPLLSTRFMFGWTISPRGGTGHA